MINKKPNELDSNIPTCENKYIVAGFPGTGKSFGSKYFPHEFIDIDSADYHWINTGTCIVKNPEWPNNYLNAIEKAYSENHVESTILCICISTHPEVLRGLHERGLHFIAIFPKDKKNIMMRYKKRGTSDLVIEVIDKNFENYRNDILNSHADMIIFSDQYMTDIMSYFANC